jgi:hypothetical protein
LGLQARLVQLGLLVQQGLKVFRVLLAQVDLGVTQDLPDQPDQQVRPAQLEQQDLPDQRVQLALHQLFKGLQVQLARLDLEVLLARLVQPGLQVYLEEQDRLDQQVLQVLQEI